MTVIELADKPDQPAKVLLSAASNTTIASGAVKTRKYSPDAIQETATAAAGFVKRLQGEFGLGPEQIRVVGSSGLPSATNRQELVDAVAQATGLPPMELITPCREVELAIAGLVPRSRWQNSAFVDVGSGNTKGGCLGSDGRGACLSVDLGSVTFADRVSKDANGKPFDEVAEALRSTLIEEPLAEQARTIPGMMTRPMVYLSGGAAYAMTTLMHPEAILLDQVEFTSNDISDYLRRLVNSPRVPVPDFEAIPDPKIRAAAVKEFGKVRDTFTRENLVSGAEILVGLATVLHLDGKILIFDRNGATAWLRAILDPSLVPTPIPPIEPEAIKPTPAVEKPKINGEVEKVRLPEEKPGRTLEPVSEKVERVFPSPQSPQPPKG